MWTALATVYEAQGDIDNAIQAHERAIQGADRSQMISILAKLASLHHTRSIELSASSNSGSGNGFRSGMTNGRDLGVEEDSLDDPSDPKDRMKKDAARQHGAQSASWHQQLIALGEEDGLGVGELASSYVAVAEWHMRCVIRKMNDSGEGPESGSGRPVSKGRYARGKSMGGEAEPEGDLGLASLYLEKVKGTTVPQNDIAQDLYRRLQLIQARLAVGL